MNDYESNPSINLTARELHRKGPSRGKARFEVRNNKPQQKQANKPRQEGFNHEALLRIYRGAELFIETTSDGYRCKLVDCDKYTLLVSQTFQDGRSVQTLLHKSHIVSIQFPAGK